MCHVRAHLILGEHGKPGLSPVLPLAAEIQSHSGTLGEYLKSLLSHSFLYFLGSTQTDWVPPLIDLVINTVPVSSSSDDELELKHL